MMGTLRRAFECAIYPLSYILSLWSSEKSRTRSAIELAAAAVALASFVDTCSSSRVQKQYEAWALLNSTSGKSGDAGRRLALEDLHQDQIKLDGVSIDGADISGISLAGARLRGAQMNDAVATAANFMGATLDGMFAHSAKFQHACFDGASLGGAKLVGANLYQADLQGADLHGADLTGADLESARLDGADLQSATLTNAKLRGASLARARLDDATLDSIRGWAFVRSFEQADVTGVRAAPAGFREHVLDRGGIDRLSTMGNSGTKENKWVRQPSHSCE